MRRFLTSAVMLGTSLTLATPVAAKSIWLNCGGTQINLDSQKERFTLTTLGKIYQGVAMFSAGQIDFEYQWYTESPPYQTDGLKAAITINRKTLEYTNITMKKDALAGITQWTKFSKTYNDKCTIIKNPPTAGNKI